MIKERIYYGNLRDWKPFHSLMWRYPSKVSCHESSMQNFNKSLQHQVLCVIYDYTRNWNCFLAKNVNLVVNVIGKKNNIFGRKFRKETLIRRSQLTDSDSFG